MQKDAKNHMDTVVKEATLLFAALPTWQQKEILLLMAELLSEDVGIPS